MLKKDIFFVLICLFVIKLILLPVLISDAFVLLILVSYRPVSKLIKIKEKVVISEEIEHKFEKINSELKSLDENFQSFKTKEAIVQQFGTNFKK
jgi:hypothetical protein